MKVKSVDLSKVLKKYSSTWLALDARAMRVVAYGKEPGLALKKAREKGFSHPVLTRAPKNYGAYIL